MSQNSYDSQSIDLTKDTVFQYFFKTHHFNLKSLLTAFLPLPDKKRIHSVQIMDPGLLPEKQNQKHSFLDVKVTLSTGEKVNVEMQNLPETHFPKRILFYLSRLYSEDLKQGLNYGELVPAYCLVFTRFNLFPGTKDYYSSFSMRRDKKPCFVFDKSLRIVVVELSKFPKQKIDHLLDLREEWCYLLKKSGQMGKNEALKLSERSIDMKEAMSHFAKLTEPERRKLWEEQKQKTEGIIRGRIEYAENKARERGMAAGLAEGRSIGIEEGKREGKKVGITEGKKEGKKAGMQQAALKMLQENADRAFVSRVTGLSEKELLKLKKNKL